MFMGYMGKFSYVLMQTSLCYESILLKVGIA
jgi:hypothetical protein